MKIEICEQMLHTWLRHCKLCEIAQTNWKVSPLYIKTISKSDKDYIQAFIEEVKIHFPKIFNIDADQMIGQCEVDIVGIKLDDNRVDHVYLVDTAFHKDGLGYSDTTRQVIMKIARAAAISWVAFGKNVPTKVIFASPKCYPTPERRIRKAEQDIKPFINKYFPNVFVEIYFNKDFTDSIYEPLLRNMNELYDDTDLFMRALHLAKLADKHIPKSTVTSKATCPKRAVSKSSVTPTASTTISKKPRIILTPSDPAVFKSELLHKKIAEITWVYSDGTQEDKTWHASKFQSSSDVFGNIESRPQWVNKAQNGLVEVRIKVL